jgi:hypothetical protein
MIKKKNCLFSAASSDAESSQTAFGPAFCCPEERIRPMLQLFLCQFVKYQSRDWPLHLKMASLKLAKWISNWWDVMMRATKHIPVSQLEIATLAFVICAIIIYLFWSIPQGITASVEINRERPIRGHTPYPFASNPLNLGGYCRFDVHFWPGETFRPDLMFPPPTMSY